MLLTKIFQTTGGQRTETFLSSADVGQDNFAAAMLDQMSRRRSGAGKVTGTGSPAPHAPNPEVTRWEAHLRTALAAGR
jgi:hypothetical protein